MENGRNGHLTAELNPVHPTALQLEVFNTFLKVQRLWHIYRNGQVGQGEHYSQNQLWRSCLNLKLREISSIRLIPSQWYQWLDSSPQN
ncbi:hypothetical protein ILYODFUR_019516 [Ilyodon furcidens]|uniref:Uncharacterized protein n=1 Tax=Ilyodon furcidens TaxID=33524 RepID=A0ABV0V796_9TELE